MTEKHPFDWECHPEAEAWLFSLLNACREKNPFILTLERELAEKTSTRLFDWIDHFTLDASPSVEQELERTGFALETTMPHYRVFTHPGAKFPSLLVREGESKHPLGLAIKVESVAHFLMVRGIERVIEGSPLSPYRRCCVHQENGQALLAVERRSTRAMEPVYLTENEYLLFKERWLTRPRNEDDATCLEQAIALAEEGVNLLGKDPTAWIICECEREYWQVRNRAAQIQKARQDRLGMGWANHDHHTFRSSRPLFFQLVRLFETVGFFCRERFYAGEQAGWGAQVMENTSCGLVLFLDVDLAPQELEIDFAHHPLPPRKELGTVGLWCALHGDSIVKAGMHHLEAQFAFDQLKADLAESAVGMMDPFSHFPYLKQAFTEGEHWDVAPSRIEALVQAGQITHEMADRFSKQGAVGSHLENLQRNEGYKGFNKNNVSLIIKKTDPRTLQI